MGGLTRAQNHHEKHEPLSKRERAVAALMCEGLTNKEIGDHLGISSHTIKFHVCNVMVKLDSATRTEAAVKYALIVERMQQGAKLVTSTSFTI